MNGKAMGMLVLAGLCGLGAMYGTSRFLSKDKGPGPVEMQDVVVAARALKIEEVIKPDLLKIEQKPKAAIHPGSFSSIKDVEERWVQIGMLEGEQVLDGKLAPKGSPPGLTSRIPAGMRAIAVEVNEQTGVAGFVLPDHRVDVIQMLPSTNPQQPQEADTVLQDVLVLASGQTFTRPDDRSMQVRTVTLALTPEQVDIIVAARQRGPISLSLRGLNDHKEIVSKRQKKEQAEVQKPIEVVVQPPPPPPPPEPPKVELPRPEMVLDVDSKVYVDPNAKPDDSRRLILHWAPTHVVLRKSVKSQSDDSSSQFAVPDPPTVPIKSVDLQFDGSPAVKMKRVTGGYWSADASEMDWRPGVHALTATVRLETEDNDQPEQVIERVVLVKDPGQFVYIYRGSSSVRDQIRIKGQDYDGPEGKPTAAATPPMTLISVGAGAAPVVTSPR